LRLAVYPGSFDPITNGHIDVLERSSKLFDRIIIAVVHNLTKKAMFSLDERVEMIRESEIFAFRYRRPGEIGYFTGIAQRSI
jgi:pantetheine-phosphate adenylyltransferase